MSTTKSVYTNAEFIIIRKNPDFEWRYVKTQFNTENAKSTVS